MNIDQLLQSVSPKEWQTFASCRYEKRQFRPYSSTTITDEYGNRIQTPNRQYLDGEHAFSEDDDWDHEHCDLCNVKITSGDWYWTSVGNLHVDFCERCYYVFSSRLKSE